MSKELEYLDDLLCMPQNLMGYGKFKGNEKIVNENVTLNKWTTERIDAIKQALEHYDQIMSADSGEFMQIFNNFFNKVITYQDYNEEYKKVKTLILKAQAKEQEIIEIEKVSDARYDKLAELKERKISPALILRIGEAFSMLDNLDSDRCALSVDHITDSSKGDVRFIKEVINDLLKVCKGVNDK